MERIIENEKTTYHLIRSEDGEIVGEFIYNWALAPQMFIESYWNIDNETFKYIMNTTPEEKENIKRQARIYYLQQELSRLQSL